MHFLTPKDRSFYTWSEEFFYTFHTWRGLFVHCFTPGERTFPFEEPGNVQSLECGGGQSTPWTSEEGGRNKKEAYEKEIENGS